MSRRSGQTLADLVIIAVSPALIMALVGSLVFFLLEVLYAGQYPARMRWILFFFVFGAVLIARISMIGEIAKRASLYGLVLGLLVWLGMQAYAEYPPGTNLARFGPFVSLGLIGLIWWCAHRLTWDCTHIDDTAEATGQGVLQAAGLEETPPSADVETELTIVEESDEKGGRRRVGWLERYRRYRAERDRKHTPGVWVVWFSLAALPLFGLGQALIPSGETGRRRYVFWLLGIYVASGLGLLLTTAFLGLRRYLRQRGLTMPPSITGIWLSVGTVLIVAILIAGVLLPRPHAEYSLLLFERMKSPARQASQQAVKSDGKGKDDGRAGSESEPAAKKDEGRTGKEGEPGGKDKDKGPGEQGGKDDGDKEKRDSGRGGEKKQGQKPSEGKEGKESAEGQPPATPANPASGLAAVFASLMEVLRWVVFAILALVVAVILLKALLQFLANFTSWARGLLDSLRSLWQGLFGWLHREAPVVEVAEETGPTPPAPFASFANPFRDGRAGHLSPEELVRYSFAALEAWAQERDLGREQGETPFEFAGRVAEEVPSLETEVRQLAALFARAAYAPGPLPSSSHEILRQFWQRLDAVAEQPLSA